jgi:phage-related protein (TIGR01555 family)
MTDYPVVKASPSGFSTPLTYIQEQKSLIQRVKQVNNDNFVKVRTDGWMNVLTGLGVCGRDKKQSAFFRITNIFNRAELDQMYRSDGVLRLIIDIFAQEMIRQGYEIEGDSEGKITGKLEELKCNEAMTNLIKWARLFGGSVCIMGIADGLPLDQPVDERAIRDVQWLRVFDRYQAYSRDGTFESDLNSPNYGFPNVYTINDNRTGAIFFVHYSRILRMDWNVLPPRWQNFNQGWGDPLVQTIYEELRNYQTCFSNTATMMQDFVNGVLKVPNLSAIMASQCGDEKVIQRLNILNLSKSTTNTMILDGDETYEKITTNVSGIAELLDRFMLALSAVTRVPVSLLFGRSAAGLNSTGDNDVRNFYDAVKQDQESKLRGVLEKLIRYIMISKDGPFNGVQPESWSLQFVPLWQNTEEQESLIRRTVAETDAIYIDRGVLTPEEVAVSRFGGDKWSMNTEIDLAARERMDPTQNEIAELEAEKEKNNGPDVTTGPDYMGTGLRGTYARGI